MSRADGGLHFRHRDLRSELWDTRCRAGELSRKRREGMHAPCRLIDCMAEYRLVQLAKRKAEELEDFGGQQSYLYLRPR